MKQKINNKKVSGRIMVVVGFIMILINAIGYIFHLDITSAPLTIMGLVFVAIGMKIARKPSK